MIRVSNFYFSVAIISFLLLSCSSEKREREQCMRDSLESLKYRDSSGNWLPLWPTSDNEKSEPEELDDEGEQVEAKFDTVTVSSAIDFMEALLDGHRNIVIDVDEEINLADALPSYIANKRIPEYGYETRNKRGIYYESFGDDDEGYGLYFVGIDHLSIRSVSAQVRFVVKDRWPTILSFDRCLHLHLENLYVGHLVHGFCMANVIDLYDCKDVTIRRCELFGCGYIGINAISVFNLFVQECEIHHCSSEALNLTGKNIYFNNCIIHRCYSFLSWEGEELIFTDCQISNVNSGLLSGVWSPVVMNECNVICHEGWGSNDIRGLKMRDCKMDIDEEGEKDGYQSVEEEEDDDDGSDGPEGHDGGDSEDESDDERD